MTTNLSRELLHRAAEVAGGIVLASEMEPPRVEPSGAVAGSAVDLYSGPLGQALLWAAMARCRQDQRQLSRRRALHALEPTRRLVERWAAHPSAAERAEIPLGGLRGHGAVVYTLACAAHPLDEPGLAEEACVAASLATEEQISAADQLDIFFGSAGALLAFLALDRICDLHDWTAAKTAGLIDRAAACGRHLLARRQGSPGEPRAWSISGQRLTGFSHGAAGIAYALVELYRRTGEAELVAAAREAMAFERRLYRAERSNWLPYPEFDEAHRLISTWCLGAPGIGLGRLAILEVLDEPDVRWDLERALEATLALPAALEDDLCCGNMGRASVLFQASRCLAGSGSSGSPEGFRSSAHDLAYGVLARAKGRGGFLWSRVPPGFKVNPYFFQGAAGLGYTWLHWILPDQIPQVLLLEAPRTMKRSE